MDVSPVVGRSSELAAIDRFFAAPWPRLLFLRGEAGIGKSTLIQAAARAAAALGLRAITCRNVPAELPMPFAGLDMLLTPDRMAEVGPQLDGNHRTILDAVLGRADGSVADIRSAGLAAAHALAIFASDEPCLILIDDLHWMDEASVTVLAYALRRLRDRPYGILVAARPAEGTDPGALLDAVDDVDVIDLEPLPLGAVGRLLQERLGIRMSRSELARLWDVAHGNPLTAIELGRAARGGAAPAADVAQTMLIQRRLAALSEGVRTVVALVAAAGEPTIDLVEEISGDRAMADAISAGVVAAVDGRLICEHPLVGIAAYELLTSKARRALHADLAARSTSLEQQATHRALSIEGDDAATAELLEMAADRAGARGAAARAADLAAMAAQRTPEEQVPARLRRRVSEIRWLAKAGGTTEATTALDGLVAATVPGPGRVPLLLLGADLAAADDDRHEAVRWAEQALQEAGSDKRLQARCHAAIAQSSPYEVAVELAHAERVLELVDDLEEPTATTQALTIIAVDTLAAGEGLPVEVVERALSLEPLTQDIRVIDRPSSALANTYMTAGDLTRAREMLGAAIASARREGDEPAVPMLLTHLAGTELRAGHLAVARRLLTDAAEIAEDCELDRPFVVFYRLWLAALAGEFAAVESTLEELGAVGQPSDDWMRIHVERARGVAALQQGAQAAAAAHLAEAHRLAAEFGVLEPAYFGVAADLVESLVALDRLDEAAAAAADIEASAARGGLGWTMLAAQRSRLLLSGAGRDADGVAGALAAIEPLLAACQSPYEVGRTRLAAGRALLRLGRRRDARQALENAAGLFRDHGLAGWEAVAQSEMRRLGGRSGGRWQLTESERQVAELVSSGLSNREVAEQLFVSVRTVESHLSSAYRKLGVRSRTGLVAAMRDGADN